MKKKNLFFNILVIFSFAVIAYILVNKRFQNDTYYTIKIGESITKYGIDMKDHFSFITDLAYVYPHWLFDLIIYLFYSFGGFTAIYVLIIALSFILLCLMYNLSNKLGNNKYISYTLICASSVFLGGFFTARAQIFSYIFFIIILYSIEMLRKTNKKRYLLYLFVSSLLIANLHSAVWLFIFVLYLPFIVQDLVFLLLDACNIKQSFFNVEIEKSHLKITLIAIVVCLITGFLTPNFLVPFTYYINTKDGISLNNISEHLPATIKNSFSLFVIALFMIITLLHRKVKIKLRDLLLIMGLFIMAFSSLRNRSLLILLSYFSFARMLSMIDFRVIEPYIWNKYFMSFIFILLSVLLIVCTKSNSNINYVNKKLYPVEASNYIIDNLDYKNIKLFNQYDYGSYLLFKNIPVFIDSRADLYLEEFNKNCKVFADYFNGDYRNNFKKYNITHVLLKNSSSLFSKINTYEDYKVIYEDSYFTLYELGD